MGVNVRNLDQLREIVRQRRKELGLTQKLTSGLIGHTQKWLSDFESGKVDPPASMLIGVMGLLEIPLQYELPNTEPDGLDQTEFEIDFDMKLDR